MSGLPRPKRGSSVYNIEKAVNFPVGRFGIDRGRGLGGATLKKPPPLTMSPDVAMIQLL